MIEKIRKKYIKITMIAVISVFMVITLSINGLFSYRTISYLNEITHIIVDSGGHLRKNKNDTNNIKDDNHEIHKNDGPHQDEKIFRNKEMPFATRYFFAVYDEENNLTEINLDYIASVEQSDAEKIADSLISKGESTGWNDNMRYRVAKIENGYMVVVMDAENQVKSILSILGITVVVSLLSTVLLYIIIKIFSKKIIRPITESYEKQKQFITDAGHELKTPLTAISANMEIIKMTSGETKWTDAVERQTDKMTRLITQLIRLSKMDEESMQHEMNEFSLSEAISDTADAFSGVAENKGLNFKTDIQPDISVINDESAVRQLVSILMDNALKYCDNNGEITVILKLHTYSFSKNKAILIVRNDFADTDKFEPDKVFDRFYRGNKAHVSDGSFGLGLSIARSVAESCNIQLSADKNSDKVWFSMVL